MDKKKYESDRIYVFYSSSSSMSQHKSLVNEFPKGKLVEVYYNPDDKHYTVLKTGSISKMKKYYYAGWGFLIGGIIFVLSVVGKLLFVRK